RDSRFERTVSMVKLASVTSTFLAALYLAACASADNAGASGTGAANVTSGGGADASTTDGGSVASTPMPDSVHWFRNSAEYQAASRQAFGLATTIVTAKSGNAKGAWGVIVDGDETILDNSEFMKEEWQQNVSFTPARWAEWVSRRASG